MYPTGRDLLKHVAGIRWHSLAFAGIRSAFFSPPLIEFDRFD